VIPLLDSIGCYGREFESLKLKAVENWKTGAEQNSGSRNINHNKRILREQKSFPFIDLMSFSRYV
jgi:hypothetical protein